MILAPRAHSVRMASSEGVEARCRETRGSRFTPAVAAQSGFAFACTSNNPMRISAEPLKGRKRK